MRSSATQPQLPPRREMEAYRIGATCARKSRCFCSRALPRPLHSRHSAWHKPRCCPEHPTVSLGSLLRKLPPSPNREMDLRLRLPPSDPSAHLAQCPPSAKMSIGWRKGQDGEGKRLNSS